MARAKKTEEAAVTAPETSDAKEVAVTEQVPADDTKVLDVADLRNEMVQVGIKLCQAARAGKFRDEQTIYGAICNIYNAIK
jgi:hypothetical protein